MASTILQICKQQCIASSPHTKNIMRDRFLNNVSFQTCLGTGAFGIVFAARCTLTQQRSAVKFVCKDNLTKNEQLVLERESILCRRLPSHANVVRVLDVVEKTFRAEDLKNLWDTKMMMTEDQHAIRDQIIGMAERRGQVTLMSFQMELCGTTLRHWLQDDFVPTMDPSDLHAVQFMILQDTSEGLKFLHNNKIIHRYIKPENILFSQHSTGYAFPLKIGDFGLCRTAHSVETKTAALTSKVGTWDYMAPEVIHGEYGQQCDIYSFGLMAWEVVQLIPCNMRKRVFDALVNDRDYGVIQDLTAFRGMKELVISMTMRKANERMERIDGLQLSLLGSRRQMPKSINVISDWTTQATTNKKGECQRALCCVTMQPKAFMKCRSKKGMSGTLRMNVRSQKV